MCIDPWTKLHFLRYTKYTCFISKCFHIFHINYNCCQAAPISPFDCLYWNMHRLTFDLLLHIAGVGGMGGSPSIFKIWSKYDQNWSNLPYTGGNISRRHSYDWPCCTAPWTGLSLPVSGWPAGATGGGAGDAWNGGSCCKPVSFGDDSQDNSMQNMFHSHIHFVQLSST